MTSNELLTEAAEQVNILRAKWNAMRPGQRGRNAVSDELDWWIGRRAYLSAMVAAGE